MQSEHNREIAIYYEITSHLVVIIDYLLGCPHDFLINDSMKDFYFFMLPSGIMLVNFIGCFFIGIAMAYISDFKSNAYYLLIVGFLGSFTTMMIMFTQINIMLAVFNMIPIPPLDGSQIFSGMMIRKNPDLVMKLQMYGPQILMGLILFGMFTSFSPIWMIISPFVNFFMLLFAGM